MRPPEPVILAGRHVRLEPLDDAHAPGLLAVGRDPAVFRHMLRPAFTGRDDVRAFLDAARAAAAAGTQLPFAILALPGGEVAGSTRYLNISTGDSGLEIGWTFLGASFQRTAVNTECKYLLLSHAFETLGAVRVQLKTDVRNERSRRAIERLGAVFEGVLRKYQLTQGDRHRDTALYSILDDEWPAVRLRLREKLAAPR
jgi:RimJ/RimL family protein N-acetyltransferase